MTSPNDPITLPRWAVEALSSAGLAQTAVLTVKRQKGWNFPTPTVRIDGGPPQPLFVDDAILGELTRATKLAKDSLR